MSATPIKTLRFYDELGLLRPAEVDVRTRYRYYDAAQLRDLAAIRALRDLGASLADIRRVRARSDGERERQSLLAGLRSDALRRLNAAHRSLQWIDLALEGASAQARETTVVLKDGGEIRIASIRARLASYDDIAPMERDLAHVVHPVSTGQLRGVLWHRCEASGAIDGEPFVEMRGRISRAAGYEIRQLPGARVASAYCECEEEAAVRTYDAIDRWIHRRSLRLDGPKREIYLGNILEIQFPVRSA